MGGRGSAGSGTATRPQDRRASPDALAPVPSRRSRSIGWHAAAGCVLVALAVAGSFVIANDEPPLRLEVEQVEGAHTQAREGGSSLAGVAGPPQTPNLWTAAREGGPYLAADRAPVPAQMTATREGGTYERVTAPSPS
jgi:hypothetical protein